MFKMIIMDYYYYYKTDDIYHEREHKPFFRLELGRLVCGGASVLYIQLLC